MKFASPRSLVLLSCGLLALGLVACKEKAEPPREVTKLERAEAAHLVSEAEFALQIREFDRAETLLTNAVTLVSDEVEYWSALGAVRKRLGNTAGAREAYERTAALYGDAYGKDVSDPAPLIQQAYMQALLGQFDEAKKTVERAAKAHPTSQQIKALVDENWTERVKQDPAFKEAAL